MEQRIHCTKYNRYVQLHFLWLLIYICSVDVEEMTQKAGNFKKFSVYVQMLVSAFAKDNENLFIDIVTTSDLERMKAQKKNDQNNSQMANRATTPAAVSTSLHSKSRDTRRFVILTYVNQFDRVHYPLPLLLEEAPNVPALQRTIRRLKREVEVLRDDKVTEEFSSEKER
jgi:coiled-coil domain-containing protein 61